MDKVLGKECGGMDHYCLLTAGIDLDNKIDVVSNIAVYNDLDVNVPGRSGFR